MKKKTVTGDRGRVCFSDELMPRKHHNVSPLPVCRDHMTLTEASSNCLPVVTMTSQTCIDVGEAARHQPHRDLRRAKRTLHYYARIRLDRTHSLTNRSRSVTNVYNAVAWREF